MVALVLGWELVASHYQLHANDDAAEALGTVSNPINQLASWRKK